MKEEATDRQTDIHVCNIGLDAKVWLCVSILGLVPLGTVPKIVVLRYEQLVCQKTDSKGNNLWVFHIMGKAIFTSKYEYGFGLATSRFRLRVARLQCLL